MRVFCDLSVSRDDGEPMSSTEIENLKKAVADSGLVGTIFQQVPYISDECTEIVWNCKAPIDWNSFRQQVIDLSRDWKEYLFHLSGSEWLWPAEYDTKGAGK